MAILADGLEAALSKSTAEASLILQDLDLTGNSLTTASLARLAKVIEAAAGDDLRALIISNNQLRVNSDQEAAEWETFLSAFSHCRKVRRLDFSGNAGLGTRAMEVFARVHGRQPQIAPRNTEGKSCGVSNDEGNVLRSSIELPSSCGAPSCYGLRSIAYINLTGIDITAAGALWLSSVLEDHFFPSQLGLEPSAAEKVASSRKLPLGLEYSMDRIVGSKCAAVLLAETEKARHRLLLANGEGEALSEPSKFSRQPGVRRASLNGADGGLTEVDRLRHRIQRHLLTGEGRSEVELWRVAFTILKCCNGILALSLDLADGSGHIAQRKHYTGAYRLPSRASSTSDHSAGLSPDTSPLASPLASPLSSPLSSPVSLSNSVPCYRSYAKLVKVAPEDAKRVNHENRPMSPRIVLKPSRRDTASEDKDLAAAAKQMVKLAINQGFVERAVRWQERRIKSEGGQTVFRDQDIVCHLPKHLLMRSLSTAVSERDVGLLSGEQMDAILTWTLRTDRPRGETVRQAAWRGKDPSVLAWSTLDAVSCMEYVP